jgi:hypothetical protein
MNIRMYASGRFGGSQALQEPLFLLVVSGFAAHYEQKWMFVGKVTPSPCPFA